MMLISKRSPFLGKWMAILLLLALLLSFGGCTSREAEESFLALDTLVTVRLYGKDAQAALQATKQAVMDFQSRYDVRNASSEIARLNAAAGAWTEVSADTVAQICLAKQVSESLPQTFALSLYPVSLLWGFGTETASVPSTQALKSALTVVDDEKIEVDTQANRVRIPKGMALDFGGIAKGYLGSLLVRTLSEYDLVGAYLSLGGNVQLYGVKPDGAPWRIGITDPQHPGNLLGVLQTDAKAVVTSGSYQRYFEQDGARYHHILDPKTGCPAEQDCASVTVITADGGVADALSTAFFVAGFDRTVQAWQTMPEVEFVYVFKDGSVAVSEGIADTFTPSDAQADITVVRRQNG